MPEILTATTIDETLAQAPKLRLVIISDTHNLHHKLSLPSGDVLIHCGDATLGGSRSELLDFLNWFSSRPHRHKIYVPGNHDFYVEEDFATAQILCIERGIKLLVDRPLVINDVKFYGSPWVPNLQMWAYYGDHITLVSRFSKIPADTDVLITHGPAAGILDHGSHHYGSTELRDRIDELHLKAHCFGHVHEDYGQLTQGTTKFINACSCNIEYEAVNAPIVVDI